VQVPPVSGQEWHAPDASPADIWLDHLSRISYIRGHISVFAVGSVVLLAVNLLSGSGGVWADTAIVAWAVLVVVHGIIAVIARLLQELLADDDEGEQKVRPASEMRWSSPSTWAIQSRSREASEAPASAPEAAPSPSAAAAPETPVAKSADTERVSWKAATDAAWLAPRDTGTSDTKPDGQDEAAGKDTDKADKPDNEDDFTPLKLD
jgi:hypothetical protein